MHAHGLYAQELWLAMRSMPAAAAALAAVRRGVDPNTNPTLTPTPTLTLTLTPTLTCRCTRTAPPLLRRVVGVRRCGGAAAVLS